MILASDALTDRTVLITGASGGIGSAAAAAVAAAGAHVVAQYRTDGHTVRSALNGIPANRVHLLEADLSTAGGARALWQAAARWRPVDVLVANAAVNPPSPMTGPDDEWDAGWELALRVNVIGSGALVREAVRSFAERGSGTVVALSSWTAEQGSRILDSIAYAASKAAFRNLAQTLARHYAGSGVAVHIVAPGVVDGGMGTAGLDHAAFRRVAEGLAMGKHVGVGEVADLIAFLATGACPSLTGGTVDLNGASYIR